MRIADLFHPRKSRRLISAGSGPLDKRRQGVQHNRVLHILGEKFNNINISMCVKMFFYSYSASVCSFYSGNPMANIFPSIREENIALDFQTPISALTQSNFMHKSKNGSFVTFCLCFPYSNCETNYMTKAFSKHLVFPLSKVKLNT